MLVLKLPKEQKEQLIETIQSYFEEERGERIGTLAAEQCLDYMIGHIGPFIYNQALADCRKVVTERAAAFEDDIYALEKPVNSRR